jgi:DNA gyrase subunit A
VVSLKGVSGDYDLLIITKNGIIIRTGIDKISVIGRNTQGVKLISLEESDTVIDITLCEKGENEETPAITELPPSDVPIEEASDAEDPVDEPIPPEDPVDEGPQQS